ncbi:MAG: hypothetical protein A2W72_07355 [Burkholderiales bacterium RIFCSPLOWO2_12_67_14]|nr:MAG: hypothetical protein A3I64_06875 [Burkholderiales bacterium RIFCSPLOWO2_02_FULL_67_64]OGB49379.1 MAG: hypothetical protein A2W72_07355 [Burkholderiales bacterium RIFCSPLOWO2_12_67_14]OGB77312.1 MAG: hypothetical protein A3G82_20440 [Burkholderiales bacterium RIFCSPLOWO2_12_FULL_67_210]
MKSNQRATIETLLERNTSQREIARITGIDRKTVRSYHQRWLEQLQSNSPGVATSLCEPWREGDADKYLDLRHKPVQVFVRIPN